MEALAWSEFRRSGRRGSSVGGSDDAPRRTRGAQLDRHRSCRRRCRSDARNGHPVQPRVGDRRHPGSGARRRVRHLRRRPATSSWNAGRAAGQTCVIYADYREMLADRTHGAGLRRDSGPPPRRRGGGGRRGRRSWHLLREAAGHHAGRGRRDRRRGSRGRRDHERQLHPPLGPGVRRGAAACPLGRAWQAVADRRPDGRPAGPCCSATTPTPST